MTDMERALRAIDEGDCEHRSHVVVPWVVKAADRIAELEAENARLRLVMLDAAHIAASCGSGSTGSLRGRFMTISNAINAALGRSQSSHGERFDIDGKVIEKK